MEVGKQASEQCFLSGIRDMEEFTTRTPVGSNGQTTRHLHTESECESLTGSEIFKMLEKQEYRCELTGRVLEPATASIDHMIPLSRGGDHVKSNAQIVHGLVNRAKCTMTNDEFIRMCYEVVEWDRREQVLQKAIFLS